MKTWIFQTMFLITHQYIFHFLEVDLFVGNYIFLCTWKNVNTKFRTEEVLISSNIKCDVTKLLEKQRNGTWHTLLNMSFANYEWRCKMTATIEKHLFTVTIWGHGILIWLTIPLDDFSSWRATHMHNLSDDQILFWLRKQNRSSTFKIEIANFLYLIVVHVALAGWIERPFLML